MRKNTRITAKHLHINYHENTGPEWRSQKDNRQENTADKNILRHQAYHPFSQKAETRIFSNAMTVQASTHSKNLRISIILALEESVTGKHPQ